jgi:hypothetical protein
MKTNVKFKVDTDEENRQVLEHIKRRSKQQDFVWGIYINYRDYGCDNRVGDLLQAVFSLWKTYRYFAVDADKNVILCSTQKVYTLRPEKEISFQEFLEDKEMGEPKEEIVIDGVRYVRK